MDTVSGIARLYADLVSLNENVKVKQEWRAPNPSIEARTHEQCFAPRRPARL